MTSKISRYTHPRMAIALAQLWDRIEKMHPVERAKLSRIIGIWLG